MNSLENLSVRKIYESTKWFRLKNDVIYLMERAPYQMKMDSSHAHALVGKW